MTTGATLQVIVDSSAIVAIVFEEPDYKIYVQQIVRAGRVRMAAPSLVETCVAINRDKGSTGLIILRTFLAESNIQIEPFTVEDTEIAFAAYRRFGKGMGHPAQLNILGTCSYVLATRLKKPLLFKGMDFSRTDVVRVPG